MKGFKKSIYRTPSDFCANCTETSVLIGTQQWSTCNLNVTTYRDGTPIPEVTDPSAWAALTTGAWCWYNNDSANGPTYGKLYNWYAINDTVHGGIAPVGYHVPTDTEWSTLLTYLGGASVAGNELRETGLCHWNPINTSATNTTGFGAIGAGVRFPNGTFNYLKDDAQFWTSTEDTSTNAWRYYIYQTDVVQRFSLNKKYGHSVRLVKDCECVAGQVSIGTQIWTCQNLNVSTYRNGVIIPQVTDPAVWGTLTTGAWCYYNNDPANEAVYGKLYNWYAVNDPRGLAPTGWHVPTDAEWTVLTNYLGGLGVAGGKMKEVGTSNWISPNIDATNSSCFTGLPGGARNSGGFYTSIGNYGEWWSSTENYTNYAWVRGLNSSSGSAGRGYSSEWTGSSVRLVKD